MHAYMHSDITVEPNIVLRCIGIIINKFITYQEQIRAMYDLHNLDEWHSDSVILLIGYNLLQL